jgi:hypothetical protein
LTALGDLFRPPGHPLFLGDKMKKILWFLIGFSLVAFPARFVYAYSYNQSCYLDRLMQEYYFSTQSTTHHFVGHYSSSADLSSAVMAACGLWSTFAFNVSCGDGASGCYYVNNSDTAWWGSWDTAYTGDPFPSSDSDDDGIPDECDFYPNDFSKLNTYTVDWVTVEESTGTEVAWGVQTPYGDGFALGDTSVDGSTPGYKDILYYQTDGNWYELPADCSSGSRAIDGTRDLNDKQVVEYTWTGDEYEDTPGPGTDGAPVEGTDYSQPTGSETDSESLQVIAQNTAAGVGAQNLMNENIVAGNSELNKLKINSEIHTKQGEELKGYLQDLNTAAGTLDTSVQAVETAIDENMDVPQADIDSALAEPSQSTTAYNDALLIFDEDPTLDDAPLEYQEKIDIPTYFYDLIDNNPISDIITDTRIETSGAQSYLSFDYNGQTIKLDLGGYETQLGLFGNILLGIFTLAGFLLVFRGF